MTMTAGTNQAATRSATRWMGARERWASATICTIRASIVSRPTCSARRTNAPVWLMVPPMTASPAVLGDRHRLAGHQRLVDRGPALLDDAVDRHLLARADPEPVTDLDLVEGHLVLGAVRVDPARRLRSQVQQRPDRPGRLLAGTQLRAPARAAPGW